MDFFDAMAAIKAGKKVRLPHWDKYLYVLLNVMPRKLGSREDPYKKIVYFTDEKAMTTDNISDEMRKSSCFTDKTGNLYFPDHWHLSADWEAYDHN